MWRWLLMIGVVSGIRASSLQNAAQKAYLANINAMMILTLRDKIGFGHYKFIRSDTTMSVVQLPVRYQTDDVAENVNLFILAHAGYGEMTMTTPVIPDPKNALRQTSTNMLQTYTGGLGGGVRYHEKGFEFSLGFENIFTRVGIRNKDGADIEGVVKSVYEDKYSDNVTYRLLGDVGYSMKLRDVKPYVRSGYDVFETKAAFSVESLTQFSTQSSVAFLTLGCETAPLWHGADKYLTADVYVRGNYLGGDIHHAIHGNAYLQAGMTSYWHLSKHALIRRLFVSVNTVQADDLRGYQFGFGFMLE